MVTVRAFVALLGGFAVMTAAVLVVAAILRRIAPEWLGSEQKPMPGYVFVNLGSTFLATAAGGYVTAWSAALNPLADVLGLAIVVLALSAISALMARGRQPAWYQLILVAIAPLGVLAGGLIRLRVMGIL